MRIAWFSPLPPARSGIAAYSAEVLPLLRPRFDALDVYVDQPVAELAGHPIFNARDFIARHRRNRYDLTVFQLGNAAVHDYMWGYLFHYPGLVVLHDAQLHQARALALTRRVEPRRADYVAEFRANHPDAPPAVADLIAAGLGGTLYHLWPMHALVLAAARLTLVHSRWLQQQLREQHPQAAVDAIEMGVSEPLPAAGRGRADVRRRHGIPDEAIVVAAYGGLTPEKRIAAVLSSVGALAARHPDLHVLLVGQRAEYYDVDADARAHGIADRVHITGYVDDRELPAYLLAADICSCLRWPTNRETSASWLRCLAAGKPTIVTALAHLAEMSFIEARASHPAPASPGASKEAPLRDEAGETTMRGGRAFPALRERSESKGAPPIAIAVDVLDEAESLTHAIDLLARDAELRTRLGAAARHRWEEHHQLTAMADGYEHAIARATSLPVPRPALPAHLTADGTTRARTIAAEFGLTGELADMLTRAAP